MFKRLNIKLDQIELIKKIEGEFKQWKSIKMMKKD